MPRAAQMDAFSFYRKRIPQFLLIIFCWSVLTNAVYNACNGETAWLSFARALTETNGLFPAKTGHAHHLGFMYTITGLYLLAPFISRGLHHMGNGGRVALVAVMLLLQFPPCSLAANLSSCGSLNGYALYFLLGYVNLAVMYPVIAMLPEAWVLSPTLAALLYFVVTYCISWGATALLLKVKGVRFLLS